MTSLRLFVSFWRWLIPPQEKPWFITIIIFNLYNWPLGWWLGKARERNLSALYLDTGHLCNVKRHRNKARYWPTAEDPFSLLRPLPHRLVKLSKQVRLVPRLEGQQGHALSREPGNEVSGLHGRAPPSRSGGHLHLRIRSEMSRGCLSRTHASNTNATAWLGGHWEARPHPASARGLRMVRQISVVEPQTRLLQKTSTIATKIPRLWCAQPVWSPHPSSISWL